MDKKISKGNFLVITALLLMSAIFIGVFGGAILNHGIIMRTGITCKKISCYMGDSACRRFIVKKAKIFCSYVEHF